jgi:hypothetical protein
MKDTIEKPDGNLDRWLGRREAFGLIAGRCSAAEVESLRRIRNERLYRSRARTWEDFCSQIGVSRRNVERSIRALEEFGPSFFHLAQLTHLKPEEYRIIAANVTEAGVRIGGEVIAFLPENTGKVTAAVAQLLGRNRRPAVKPVASAFELSVRRFRAATESLEGLGALEPAQKMQLAAVLLDMREKALALGVPLLSW